MIRGKKIAEDPSIYATFTIIVMTLNQSEIVQDTEFSGRMLWINVYLLPV